ncbi:MAG: flippase-like domain-containing protein [Chlorobi bacterium]|nr:flippase-like domain-containing protein [Chlorobiota bacterium]
MVKIIKAILLLGIVVYLFYGFDFSKINLDVISLKSLIASFFILFLAQVILSIRFMYIIDSKFVPSLETIVVSNALNMILPARLGEVAKALYLKKFYQYDYNIAIAAVFIERFFDVIMLFFIILYWGYFYTGNEYIKNASLWLFIFILATFLLFNSKKILLLIEKIPFAIAKEIYLSISLMLKKTHILLFWSIVLWLAYLLSYFTFFESLNLKQIVELFIVSSVAMMIPLAPAGLGTFEGVVVFYLSKYGISKEDALLLASTYHFLLFLVDMVMFFIFLAVKKISFEELKAIK